MPNTCYTITINCSNDRCGKTDQVPEVGASPQGWLMLRHAIMKMDDKMQPMGLEPVAVAACCPECMIAFIMDNLVPKETKERDPQPVKSKKPRRQKPRSVKDE